MWTVFVIHLNDVCKIEMTNNCLFVVVRERRPAQWILTTDLETRVTGPTSTPQSNISALEANCQSNLGTKKKLKTIIK